MGSTDNIAVDKIVENVLEEGEQVLWYERPRFLVISRDEKRSLIQIIFVLLWFIVAMIPAYFFIGKNVLTCNRILVMLAISCISLLISFFIWLIIKKNNLFVVTDKRIIRIINFPTFRIAQRKLSELKHYNYVSNKNGKGDMFFGPYEVTKFGGMFEYDYGYTVGNAWYHIWRHYDEYLDMTLHFFSVEHIDELIEILEEHTSAVKYDKKTRF